MKDTTIAVDLAKNVFEIAISREAGKVDSGGYCQIELVTDRMVQ